MAITILYVPFICKEKNILMKDAIKWANHAKCNDRIVIFQEGDWLSTQLGNTKEKLKVYILGHGISFPHYPWHISSTQDLADKDNVVIDMDELANRFEDSFGPWLLQIETVKLYFCNGSNGSRVADAFIDGLRKADRLDVQYYEGDISGPDINQNHSKKAYTHKGVMKASQSRYAIFYHTVRNDRLFVKEKDKQKSSEKWKETKRAKFFGSIQVRRQQKISDSRQDGIGQAVDMLVNLKI